MAEIGRWVPPSVRRLSTFGDQWDAIDAETLAPFDRSCRAPCFHLPRVLSHHPATFPADFATFRARYWLGLRPTSPLHSRPMPERVRVVVANVKPGEDGTLVAVLLALI